MTTASWSRAIKTSTRNSHPVGLTGAPDAHPPQSGSQVHADVVWSRTLAKGVSGYDTRRRQRTRTRRAWPLSSSFHSAYLRSELYPTMPGGPSPATAFHDSPDPAGSCGMQVIPCWGRERPGWERAGVSGLSSSASDRANRGAHDGGRSARHQAMVVRWGTDGPVLQSSDEQLEDASVTARGTLPSRRPQSAWMYASTCLGAKSPLPTPFGGPQPVRRIAGGQSPGYRTQWAWALRRATGRDARRPHRRLPDHRRDGDQRQHLPQRSQPKAGERAVPPVVESGPLFRPPLQNRDRRTRVEMAATPRWSSNVYPVSILLRQQNHPFN